MKIFLLRLWAKLIEFVNIHEDTDVEATMSSVRKSVEFRGANAWLLACAIVVASVGLNVNSTAVIIGAMLISPLMGPINGIGVAVGISDSILLRRSLWNFAVMVLISLVSSTTYFLISPLSDAQSELLARTNPTIYDVFIAFFGGIAGMLAMSRKGQALTIVSGVAIATALMPPLCTAGYGIATGSWMFSLGALYLFFINSFFIALASLIMVKYLRFPVNKYLDAHKKKMVKRSIYLFSIIVLVPSIFMAVSVVRETAFNSACSKYLHNIQNSEVFTGVELINFRKEYSRKGSTIFISFIGKPLDDTQKAYLNEHLDVYGLRGTKLSVKQTGESLDLNVQEGYISKLIDKKDALIKKLESSVDSLDNELGKTHSSIEMYKHLAKEIAVQYPNVEKFSVTHVITTQTSDLKQDTIPVLFVEWKGDSDTIQNQALSNWLKVRLDIPKLQVRSTNSVLPKR